MIRILGSFAVLVVAGAVAWMITRPPDPAAVAERVLARVPERAGVVHQVVETTGWKGRIDAFVFDIELWERPSDDLRRIRWVDGGLARSSDAVVDGELITSHGEARRLWYRSKDGLFVGEWRLRSADDRREALEIAPETIDIVGELRAAARSGLTSDSALESFEGSERRRITRERRIGRTIVRDRWFIDEDGARLVGMRRERWRGEVLVDNQTYLLVRYEHLAPARARTALAFAAGQ